MEDQRDIIDLLLQVGIVASFIVFGVAIWNIKRAKQREAQKKRESDGPEDSNDQ